MELPCSHKDAAENYGDSDCPFLIASFVFAGLSMMLNIRLAYSSAPYALIRFRLPENLFSVFVRRMASALELWCLPSMLLGNILDSGVKILFKYGGITIPTGDSDGVPNDSENKKSKSLKLWAIIWPSIFTMWSDFITYVVLLYIYVTGGHQPHDTSDRDPGFGGWKKYYKHKFGAGECNKDAEETPENLINNTLWHAFDLLIVIKIVLAVIFIYSHH